MKHRMRAFACGAVAAAALGLGLVPSANAGNTRPSQGCTTIYVNGTSQKVCYDTLTGGSSGGSNCSKDLTDCAPAPGCDPQKATCLPA